MEKLNEKLFDNLAEILARVFKDSNDWANDYEAETGQKAFNEEALEKAS